MGLGFSGVIVCEHGKAATVSQNDPRKPKRTLWVSHGLETPPRFHEKGPEKRNKVKFCAGEGGGKKTNVWAVQGRAVRKTPNRPVREEVRVQNSKTSNLKKPSNRQLQKSNFKTQIFKALKSVLVGPLLNDPLTKQQGRLISCKGTHQKVRSCLKTVPLQRHDCLTFKSYSQTHNSELGSLCAKRRDVYMCICFNMMCRRRTWERGAAQRGPEMRS